VDAFITIIKNIENLRKGFLRYEIGTGQSIKLKNFVKLVKSIVQNNDTVLNFGAIPYRENEVMSSKADITEICKLKWKPKYTLEEGLLRTISMEKDKIKK
jgi:nucleoside-diphosphate-sugar epimerase